LKNEVKRIVFLTLYAEYNIRNGVMNVYNE